MKQRDIKPLNGERTHPLSDHALAELRELAQAAIPTSGINPGVVNRLLRGRLARVVMLPSPFKSHKGGDCPHLQITEAGREHLAALTAAREEQNHE